MLGTIGSSTEPADKFVLRLSPCSLGKACCVSFMNDVSRPPCCLQMRMVVLTKSVTKNSLHALVRFPPLLILFPFLVTDSVLQWPSLPTFQRTYLFLSSRWNNCKRGLVHRATNKCDVTHVDAPMSSMTADKTIEKTAKCWWPLYFGLEQFRNFALSSHLTHDTVCLFTFPMILFLGYIFRFVCVPFYSWTYPILQYKGVCCPDEMCL